MSEMIFGDEEPNKVMENQVRKWLPHFERAGKLKIANALRKSISMEPIGITEAASTNEEDDFPL